MAYQPICLYVRAKSLENCCMQLVSDDTITAWNANNPVLRIETTRPAQPIEDVIIRMIHTILYEIKMACILFANAFPEQQL
jgi:hypothetical protein